MGLGNSGNPPAGGTRGRNADLLTLDDKPARTSRRHDCRSCRRDNARERSHSIAKWWDMSIHELAGEAETGLRTPDIGPDVTKGILELLHTKVASATAESQDQLAGRLVTATWVLAGATIALCALDDLLVVVTLAE